MIGGPPCQRESEKGRANTRERATRPGLAGPRAGKSERAWVDRACDWAEQARREAAARIANFVFLFQKSE
jgi:hypothetical protein